MEIKFLTNHKSFIYCTLLYYNVYEIHAPDNDTMTLKTRESQPYPPLLDLKNRCGG